MIISTQRKMKTRFSTIDIAVVIKEIRKYCGMRVNNVYDIDNKTYLIKLTRPDEKAMILMESGNKIHTTGFDWPKNMAPSGFSMKMRKHIKGRRLESIEQLGVDRIIDLQFGSGEAAYHIILELYDRGNIVLTDFEYTILNILRPRTDKCQDVRFAVKETYPIDAAKQHIVPTEESLRGILLAAKPGDQLRKILISHLDYGPALIDHSLLTAGFPDNCKIEKGFEIDRDFTKLLIAIEEAEENFKLLQENESKGYIIQKKEKRPAASESKEDLLTYDEFHPRLFKQHTEKPYQEYDSFNQAVDEFFSKLEGQKMDMKTVQQEKAALKKLENIKKDHEKRIEQLQKVQDTDINKGRLIEMNLGLVDQAILIVRSALANQIDWTEIQRLVKEAQQQGDPVAQCIKSLKLDTNHITVVLKDPYFESDDEDLNEDILRPMNIDIDLSLSAYANSRKFFDMKKLAAKKEQKTIEASGMALKSAERKTKETLKEVAMAATINKTRKTYWFEKFLWFITSENFLCVGGRDQQQNEMIVKKYLKQGDLYVHADLHGASSIVIKNHTSEPIPPKSLNEAGAMAICNSAAWDAKVVTSAWWVYHDQVSKTAPSGEYLTTGSFMVRGKKNYLPPSYLVYGFALLFKLEEGSVSRHKGERKVRTHEDDLESIADSVATESDLGMDTGSINNESDSDEDLDDDKENEEDSLQAKMEKVEITMKSENETCDKDKSIDQVAPKSDISDIKGQLNEENNSDSSDGEQMFPDTKITLQHVKGDKYELQRDRTPSESNNTPQDPVQDHVDIKQNRLSAKQRRELKKARKQQSAISEGENESIKSEERPQESDVKSIQQRNNKNSNDTNSQQQQQQPKRGQKSKIKKIKEKYADQDEEERQLRMDILASAGPRDEEPTTKKSKKARKGDKLHSLPQQNQQKVGKKMPVVSMTTTIHIEDEDFKGIYNKEKVPKTKDPLEDGESDDENQDDSKQKSEDIQILESLTGLPVPEDELLYAVPVCGPYNALVNYKYKVKLQPGSTKRGKACKLALNMFLHDRNIQQREKDLTKILKDADVSRNIPGKVKVSAPNINKVKRK